MQGFKWVTVVAALASGAAFAQAPVERPQATDQGTMQRDPQMQRDTQMQQGKPMQRGPQMQMGQQAAGPLDQDQWIAEFMLVNQWTGDMSQIASERAMNAKTKEFARQSMQHHQQLSQKLQTLAQKANVDLEKGIQSLGQKQDFMHLAMLTSLQALPTLNGMNVDRAYLSSIVLSHDLAIEKLLFAAKQVKNKELAGAIRDALPMLKEHRQKAHKLLGQFAPDIKTGQARRAPGERR